MKNVVFRAAGLPLIVAVLLASACSTAQVADTTGNAVGAVARGGVHVVAGAGRLAGRGIGAAYNAVTDGDEDE